MSALTRVFDALWRPSKEGRASLKLSAIFRRTRCELSAIFPKAASRLATPVCYVRLTWDDAPLADCLT